MKLTVVVEDAPEGWGQNAFKGYLDLLNGADLVVVNGKVTKDKLGANVGRPVDVWVKYLGASS